MLRQLETTIEPCRATGLNDSHIDPHPPDDLPGIQGQFAPRTGAAVGHVIQASLETVRQSEILKTMIGRKSQGSESSMQSFLSRHHSLIQLGSIGYHGPITMFHTCLAPRDGTDIFREVLKFLEITALDILVNEPKAPTRHNGSGTKPSCI